MADEEIYWLEKMKNDLYNSGDWDLYDVTYTTLARNRMSYLAFLKMASEGYGFSPEEGMGYSLDQDWGDPEGFDGVIFYLGEFETITMPPDRFVSRMQDITEAYVKTYPEDKEKATFYMDLLKKRYVG